MRFGIALLLVAAVLAAGCAEQPATPTTSTGNTPTPATTPATAPAGTTPAATPSPPTGATKTCASTTGSERAATPTWVLETSQGTIRITLFCDKAPLTTQHFVNLTEENYFDGTKFHRVIEGFMNQGGDPNSRDDTKKSTWGTGGPGFTIVDEFYCKDGTVSYSHPSGCREPGLVHDKAGVLSMANTGRPKTGGSQFFITAAATPWLDGKHAIFGQVADDESLQVALKINKLPTDANDRTTPPVVIERATIDWG